MPFTPPNTTDCTYRNDAINDITTNTHGSSDKKTSFIGRVVRSLSEALMSCFKGASSGQTSVMRQKSGRISRSNNRSPIAEIPVHSLPSRDQSHSTRNVNPDTTHNTSNALKQIKYKNTINVDSLEPNETTVDVDELAELLHRKDIFMSSLQEFYSDGNTVLHKLVLLDIGEDDFIISFLKSLQLSGVDLEIPNARGVTPLEMAILHGENDLAKIFLAGVDPNKPFKNKSYSPYYLAASTGNLTLIKELLKPEYKLNAYPQDSIAGQPVLIAAENNHIDVLQTILTSVPYPSIDTPLHSAAQLGYLNAVKNFILVGLDKNSSDSTGLTPLSYAVSFGRTEIVDFLIEIEADLDMLVGVSGMTAIHLAALMGRYESVEKLIQAGANTNSRTLDDQSPASLAAFNDHEDIARLLIRSGDVPESVFTFSDDTQLHPVQIRVKQKLKQMVLDAICENDYNPQLDLAGQLSTQILTQDFKNAIAQRRNLITENLVQQFNTSYPVLKQVIELDNQFMSDDLIKTIAQYALNGPEGDLATLLFPEVSNQLDENGINPRKLAMQDHLESRFNHIERYREVMEQVKKT